jgi:integrase
LNGLRKDGARPIAPGWGRRDRVIWGFLRRAAHFGIRKLVKRHLQTAAKVCPSLASKNLSTHSLRHTTAVHLLESRVDPHVIKTWLGHASVKSTDPYLDMDLTHKRQILEQFSPPPYVTDSDQPQGPTDGKDPLDWLGDL